MKVGYFFVLGLADRVSKPLKAIESLQPNKAKLSKSVEQASDLLLVRN